MFSGSAESGLYNDFGWMLQGYIEDEAGRLRLQTYEEHFACMGCHSATGVTLDQTFAFPRKVPGADGFRVQDLRGMVDAPQLGHRKPETLVYFERAGGGDEFRANAELSERFLGGGRVNARELQRAAPGGDRDLAALLFPSRERALVLNKAYMALVREQKFELGRDAFAKPAENVHAEITDLSTGPRTGSPRVRRRSAAPRLDDAEHAAARRSPSERYPGSERGQRRVYGRANNRKNARPNRASPRISTGAPASSTIREDELSQRVGIGFDDGVRDSARCRA